MCYREEEPTAEPIDSQEGLIALLLPLLLLCPLSASAEYLDDLSANPFESDSMANPFGAGSPSAPGLSGLPGSSGLSGSFGPIIEITKQTRQTPS